MMFSEQYPENGVPSRFRRPSVVRESALVFFAMSTAGAVVIIRDVLVGRRFGLGPDLDAWVLGFAILSFVVSPFATASSATLLPRLRPGRQRNDAMERSEFVSGAIAFAALLGLCAGIAGLLALSAARLVGGFDTERISALWSLLAVLGPIGGCALLATGAATAVLHTNNRFWQPAAAPLLPALLVVGALALSGSESILALGLLHSIGLLAAVLGLLVLVGVDEKLSFPHLGRARQQLSGLLGTASKAYLGALLVSLNVLVDYFVASRLAPGDVGGLGLAGRLPIATAALLASAAAVPLYPRLVDALSSGGPRALASLFRKRLIQVTAASATIGLGISLVSVPLARWMFEGGSSALSADGPSLGRLQAIYALTIAPYVAATLAVRTLHAMGLVQLALWIAAGGAIANLALNLILAIPFGLAGIASATVATHSGTAIVMIYGILLHCRNSPHFEPEGVS